MKSYVEVISRIRRLHYGYLSLISEKLDLIGVSDLHSVQAVILLHIGTARIAINEVRTKGNYLGSNLSYIIKMLVRNGYLLHERSSHDGRVNDIRLSDKAQLLCDQLADLLCPLDSVFADPNSDPICERSIWALRQIEQFWIDRTLEPDPDHR